jgi:hypothetical protein
LRKGVKEAQSVEKEGKSEKNPRDEQAELRSGDSGIRNQQG